MTASGNSLARQLDENYTDEEPAVRTGLSTTAVAAIIAGILYFWPNLPNEVVTGIVAVIGILLPIITAFLIRRKVWSPASVMKVADVLREKAIEQLVKRAAYVETQRLAERKKMDLSHTEEQTD